MVAKESIKEFKGRVHIKAWQKNPEFPDDPSKDIVIKDDIFCNAIVNVGKDSILKTLGGCGLSGGGFAGGIGVGCSAACISACHTDLQGSCKTWKDISSVCKSYTRPTLYVSVSFGYSEANFTWNEIGICDDQGTPNSPTGGSLLWARQVDGTPLAKDNTKRAIVEWQISL